MEEGDGRLERESGQLFLYQRAKENNVVKRLSCRYPPLVKKRGRAGSKWRICATMNEH